MPNRQIPFLSSVLRGDIQNYCKFELQSPDNMTIVNKLLYIDSYYLASMVIFSNVLKRWFWKNFLAKSCFKTTFHHGSLSEGLVTPPLGVEKLSPRFNFFNNMFPGSLHLFKKNSFFWKGLQISLPTSSQPPPDIKFKSSYARKRDFGLLCPNMEIRPQAPKNGIFQRKFIFLKKSPDFASNELSTTPRH